MAAPVEDIRQALSAQHEPQPAAISGLRMCPLAFRLMCLSCLTIISPYSVISDIILVVSVQTLTFAYLSATCHQLGQELRLRGLDARGSAAKWIYIIQCHSETTIRGLQVNARREDRPCRSIPISDNFK
jgi:hypothetical protein